MTTKTTVRIARLLKRAPLLGLWGFLPCAAVMLCEPACANETGGAETFDWDNSVPLFNGHDLSGWDGDPRLWSIREGVIHGETTPEKSTKGNTFLIWEGGDLEDFALKIAFRCNATNNSGIQYRSKRLDPGKAPNRWAVAGYQHEIRNENTPPNVPGFIYDERGRGRICLAGEKVVWEPQGKKLIERLLDEESLRDLIKIDDWNQSVIVAKGNHIRHYLNGKLIVDFTDKSPQKTRLSGLLALQLHQGKPMWVEFKEIKLLRLE